MMLTSESEASRGKSDQNHRSLSHAAVSTVRDPPVDFSEVLKSMSSDFVAS